MRQPPEETTDVLPLRPSMWSDWTFASIRIVGMYLAFGFVWILLSDRLLQWLLPEPAAFARWQTYKGWIFVGLTASVLHWLVHSQVDRLGKSQEALRQSEERYRNLFEKLPWPMFIYDTATLRVVAVNNAALTQYQYSFEEFLALALTDLVPAEKQGELLDAVEARSRNISENKVAIHKRKDGHHVEVELNAQPIYWRSRKCVLVLAVDLTERRNLEAQLQQAQKMEAIGLLAGGVAHDFNNMLGVILGYSEMLHKMEKDPTKMTFLTEISDAANKAAGITRQLLAFSRKQMLEMQSVDLNQMVSENDKLIQKLLGEHIEVETTLAEAPWKTRADPNQLVQVLMNLSVNARDAMPKGGRLSIRTENRFLDQRDVAVRPYLKEGAYACLVVGDTGHGMDEATQSRIFEPFFTTKEMGRGTGLGLSTVYGIVKQIGGYIWVESAPGSGAKFFVALPAQTAGSLNLPSQSLQAASAARGERILVLEDEDALRRLVTAVLREAGYEVLEAASGGEALALFGATDRVDLLLTDVVMPRLNGVEVSKLLRERNPSLPVLFVSGYASDFLAREDPLPSSEFLLKPVRREVLLARVRGMLDARKAGSALAANEGNPR